MERVIVPKHLHNTKFITRKWIRAFFSELEQAKKYKGYPDFTGYIAVSIYMEPSISTELSFNMAMLKMNIHNLSYRSMNIEDTYSNPKNMLLRFQMQGANLILLRSNTIELYDVLENMDIPTINCGCEELGNPTETLQDLYTMWQRNKRIDSLRVLAIGDLSQSAFLDATFELFEYLDIELERVSLNDFSSLRDFFKEVEKKALNANVIYLIRDSQDQFIDKTGSLTGYSINNLQIFEQVFKKLKDKNVLFLNAGSKKLNQWFNEPIFKELFQSEKERHLDGILVRVFLIRKLFELY